MALLRSTFKITNYALLALGVLFALVTLTMWVNALYWGGSYAYSEAIVWTVLTALVVACHSGIERLQNWRE